MRMGLTALLFTLLCSSACGDASDVDKGDLDSMELQHETDNSPDVWDGNGPEGRTEEVAWTDLDLAGTWAQLHVVSAYAIAPLVGQVNTISVALARWEVVASETGYDVIQVACALELQSDSEFATTIIPEAFVQAVAPVAKSVVLDLTRTPPGYYHPPTAEVHGALLDNPLVDSMPTSADDPRVFDQDGDGHPGMTVFVTGIIDGALYIVQRNVSEQTGVMVSLDRFEGLLGWEQEQIVLGSDNPILADNPPVSAIDPDPTHSYCVTVRIEDGWQCDDILANREKLFGQTIAWAPN